MQNAKRVTFRPAILEAAGNTDTAVSLFPRFQLFPDWHLETEAHKRQGSYVVFPRVQPDTSGETMIDLNAIFGDRPAPGVVPDVSMAGLGVIDTHSGKPGDVATVPLAANVLLQSIEPDEDAAPRPCHNCGSSDLWETIAGTWHCQHCDAAMLARSRSLAERAARLRRLLGTVPGIRTADKLTGG